MYSNEWIVLVHSNTEGNESKNRINTYLGCKIHALNLLLYIFSRSASCCKDRFSKIEFVQRSIQLDMVCQQFSADWRIQDSVSGEFGKLLICSSSYTNSYKVGKNMKRKRGSVNCNQPNTFWKNTVVEIVPYQWGMKFLKVKDIISKLLLFLTLSFTCALFTSTTFKRCIQLKYNLLLKVNSIRGFYF